MTVPTDINALEEPNARHALAESFGIDVLALPRVDRMLIRFGAALVGRIATGQEARWAGDPPEPQRVGALIALKEATIKACGGRMLGFTWQALEILPDAATHTSLGSTCPPSRIADILTEFGRGTGLYSPQAVTCRLSEPIARTARHRLGLGASPIQIEGAGRWGCRDGHVFAAIVLFPEGGRGT